MPSVDRTLIGNHTVIQRPEKSELRVNGPGDKEKIVTLTPEEFTLYRILNDHRGVGVEREYLINEIWWDGEGSEKLLVKNTSSLRKKLQEAGIQEDFIETAPGKKYRMLFNQKVEESASADKSLKTKFKNKALWIVLILIFLAGLIFFIADLAFPGQEEVPESPVEVEAPPVDTGV
ncbi:MAG: winged helix-turn-helix domain-containing protein [Candidatus Cyclobacteriaceae bacterium M2_1C_046]